MKIIISRPDQGQRSPKFNIIITSKGTTNNYVDRILLLNDGAKWNRLPYLKIMYTGVKKILRLHKNLKQLHFWQEGNFGECTAKVKLELTEFRGIPSSLTFKEGCIVNST